MIILYMLASACCAFGLVFLLELGWANRPPMLATQWPKGRAMRFIWAVIGVLAVLTQIPIGIMAAVAGLPVSLAHLRLTDRNPVARIGVMVVASEVLGKGREAMRRLFEGTRNGPRNRQ